MRWDPGQYGRYADERGRPFHDLVSRIGAREPRHVVDVGCGPGALTAGLAERWPDARIEGLDSSAAMIAAAAPLARDRVDFRVADASTWTPDPDVDVIVSNAALQWVPDHLSVLTRWAGATPSRGWVAIQVPANFDAPSHAIMRELADSPRWHAQLDGVLRHSDAVADPATYARLLRSAGLRADVWETTYLHQLSGQDPVLQWVRGTGLRPVLAALDEADSAEFVADYRDRLRAAYPATEHGVTFAFRRIFAVGHRA